MALTKKQREKVIEAVRDDLGSWDLMVHRLATEAILRRSWEKYESQDPDFWDEARKLAIKTIVKELPDYVSID
jgi:trans-2-enoyl-CoA reductase